ncbi:MAG: potassium channel family protein [Halieaceae bacterium]
MPHRRITREDNFIWLLGALVFLLFSGAVVGQYQWESGQRVVSLTLLVTLVTNIWALDRGKSRWVGWKIGASVFIGALLLGDLYLEHHLMSLAQLCTVLAFLCFTIYQAGNQVLFTGDIDGNKIVGAICVYFLLGLVWAFAYLLAEELYPGSLHGLADSGWRHNMQSATYYSFVTLTTLGYGDLTPAQPIARFLAYMEAVVSIFYTTILVASLIGIRLSGWDASKPAEEQESK